MMRQFTTILKFELKNYLKNKAFIGVTAFLVVLIAAVMFFPRLTADEGGEGIPEPDVGGVIVDVEDIPSYDDPSERPVILLGGEDGVLNDILTSSFSAAFAGYEVRAGDYGEEDIRNAIDAGEAEFAFLLTSADSYVYYVGTLSMYDGNAAVAAEVMQSAYRMNAMLESGLTAEQANDILSVYISGETVSLGKDQMENFFYTYVMLFALYMVILLYGQMVATGVATEKSSRAMEVLITSARPTGMMFGKVIAACLAGLIQLVAIFGSALVFYNVNKEYWDGNMIVDSLFNIPPELLAYMLVFFVLGFFIYAFLYGAIGSTASKLEDINTSVMPLTFLFIIAFFVVMFSMGSGSVDNIAMMVCSYIPFTSPMAMFTRIAMSSVPWYEILISIVILIASVIGVGVVSAKIYRVGVLLYGTPPKLGAILKAIRKA